MKFSHIVSIAALGVALAACRFGDHETRDPGPSVDRNYQVGAFQRITVAGPYDVTVTSGGAPGVKAHGGQAVLDQTDIVVENGELKIVPKKHNGIRWNWGHGDHKVTVEVTGAGALTAATIAGSGGVKIDQSNAPSFKGEVAGSGDLDIAQLKTGNAEFSIAGSGGIRAAGTAQQVKLNIAGSGDIDVPNLVATSADVSIAGSCKISAHATGTADVSIMGSGDVAITGGAKCSISKNGSGNVTCS